MSYRDSWKHELAGHDALRAVHEELRSEIQRRWQRALPFGDELFDRWERAAALGFGEGSSIYDTSVVLGSVDVGEGSWIGPFTVLDGSGGLSIGRFCSISAGVQIYTHDSVAWALTGGAAGYERSPVTVGDFTYVGPNALITRGVSVGTRCVVGAASLLNDDLPDNTIAYGRPARKVGVVEVDGERVAFRYDEGPGPDEQDD